MSQAATKRPLLVYLPAGTRRKINQQANDEGTSASAIARRVLIREFPEKK